MDEDVARTTIAAVAAFSFAKLLGTAIVAKRKKLLFEKIGTVDELYLYPIKSCGVMKSSDAFCTEVGLEKNGATDRHWMVVDRENSVVDMSDKPKMTTISTHIDTENDLLVVCAPDMPNLHLPLRPKLDMAKTFVKVFEHQPIRVLHCGEEAAKWISELLGMDAKIVYSCSVLGTRSVYERKRKWDITARSGDKTVFGFLTSYLITTTASQQDLNERLDKPVPMVNFRPNIIIRNSIPFDEDNWSEMLIGEKVLFHYVQPCLRCCITTMDAQTGEKDRKSRPLKQLRSYRCREPYGNIEPVFGSYMSVDVTGHIKVGDPVYILRKRAS